MPLLPSASRASASTCASASRTCSTRADASRPQSALEEFAERATKEVEGPLHLHACRLVEGT